MAKNKTVLDAEIDAIVEEKWKEIEKTFDSTLRKVNLEMRDEATKLYTKLIDKYYRYKTRYYIRHDEIRPGTKVGHNLYKGLNLIYSNKRKPHIIIDPEIFGDNGEMDGGYRFDEPEDILDQVMNGYISIQGPYPNPLYERNWNAEYESMLFRYQRGTMRGAFRRFNYEFDDIAEKLFYQKWDKLFN